MRKMNGLVNQRMVIGVFCLAMCVLAAGAIAGESKAKKPSPDEVVQMLKDGNARFVKGEMQHPHLDAERLKQAGSENQGDHAYATVITCSDSRVPVEAIFDAGIMDLFIIRVAGNVCDTDEVGSIEYGLAHVNTPVLVVLGHTQCGAVTAVTKQMHGHGHALERNIPPLVDNIAPAVEHVMHEHPSLTEDACIQMAIEQNVWQGIQDLFEKSPATRELVAGGKAKVVGAIYDVGTGEVIWLDADKTDTILEVVNATPGIPTNPMADGEQQTASHEHEESVTHDVAETHEVAETDAPSDDGEQVQTSSMEEVSDVTDEPTEEESDLEEAGDSTEEESDSDEEWWTSVEEDDAS